ncbi:MAG: (d)CMP kinase [Clostridia bacterium]
MIVTIDGYSSTGKSSAGRGLAEKLGYGFLGTGSIYRALTLKYLRTKKNYRNEEDIEFILKNTKIEIKFTGCTQQTFLDGEDVSNILQTPNINKVVPMISKIRKNRDFALKIQHKTADNANIVVEGRDIGSVVFPHAEYKFFFTADPVVRAKRRQQEYEKLGKIVLLDDIIKENKERDLIDTTREISPLVVPKGAKIIDTTDTTLEECINIMYNFIKKNRK